VYLLTNVSTLYPTVHLNL